MWGWWMYGQPMPNKERRSGWGRNKPVPPKPLVHDSISIDELIIKTERVLNVLMTLTVGGDDNA